METLKDRLLYDYDPEELPKIFNKLFLKLKNIHKENKFVPWLNINSIVCSEDDFIFVNSVKTDNIEEKSGENIRALAKIMIGCYMRQGDLFNDLSQTPDSWFINNLDNIFSCFNYEDFDKEYFYGVFVEQKNDYYSEYLNRKKQSAQLSEVGKTQGFMKVLKNPNVPGINEHGEEEINKLDMTARMHTAFNPLLIGMSIAVIAVVTIMIILLN